MLSSLEVAFGPGETVRAYTEQRNDVVARLVAGEDHIQPWLMSAAYETSMGKAWRIAHKRGYAWMAHEYAARMGYGLPAAPIWVGFDKERVLRCHRNDARRLAAEKVLVLDLPRSEVLLSDHGGWVTYVLEGVCLGENSERWRSLAGQTCACTGRRRRESWQGIFALPQDEMKWQGVLPRLQASWVEDIIE